MNDFLQRAFSATSNEWILQQIMSNEWKVTPLFMQQKCCILLKLYWNYIINFENCQLWTFALIDYDAKYPISFQKGIKSTELAAENNHQLFFHNDARERLNQIITTFWMTKPKYYIQLNQWNKVWPKFIDCKKIH